MSLVLTPITPGTGQFTKVVRFEIPSKASVGSVVNARVCGKTLPEATFLNFVVGVSYHDGPVNSIEYFDGKVWRPLNKGDVAFITIPKANPDTVYCTTIKVRFPKEGTYVMRGVTGWLTDNGVDVDDFLEKDVTVTPAFIPTPILTPAQPPANVLYPAIGAVIGAVGGYLATKGVKGIVAGAIAGGGIGFTSYVIKEKLPEIVGKK